MRGENACVGSWVWAGSPGPVGAGQARWRKARPGGGRRLEVGERGDLLA